MHRARTIALAAALGAILGCTPPRTVIPSLGTNPALRITDAYSITPLTVFPALSGHRFGGVSGLAYDAARHELFGISDDRADSRFFRLRIVHRPFRVEPIAAVPLEIAAGAPAKLDAEAIALLPDGHILISSEGIGNEQPRLPPALVEYTRDGRFVSQWPVRARFAPTATGPIVSGVRDNQGFESLTVTPDGSRVFTANETALAQDGPAPSVGAPGISRILEYRTAGGTYEPAREFAYSVDPIPSTSFAPGFGINGLDDLLSLGGDTLLAMERAFVEDRARPGFGFNRIRLYRVDLAGATDVSAIDSLAGRSDIHAARKTLVADLGSAQGLPPSLAALDNFEGVAVLGSEQGSLHLLLVSDDNFSRTQRTWFVRATVRDGPSLH
jgi:3-phytase